MACLPARSARPRAVVPPSPLSLAQICVPVETTSPLVTSNQKEVLRCFTVLGECRRARARAASAWARLCLCLLGSMGLSPQ